MERPTAPARRHPHRRRAGRRGPAWGWTIAALTALGLAGCAAPPPPAPGSATVPPTAAWTRLAYDGGEIAWRHDGSACRLHWRGAIHGAAVGRLRQALEALPSTACRQRVAELEGLDGVLNDAITAGSMLRNRGWDTMLVGSTPCPTPCWLVLAGGVRRAMPDGGSLLLTPLPPDADFARGPCGGEPSRAQQLTLIRYLGAMLPDPTASALHRMVVTADCRHPARLTAGQARALGLAHAP